MNKAMAFAELAHAAAAAEERKERYDQGKREHGSRTATMCTCGLRGRISCSNRQ